MSSRLSIITINRNDKEGLENTILSVVAQTFNKLQFIVIDGGSTDGSKEIIDKYSEFIDYWISEKDRGIYHAMNKGILKAKGEYCLFLNSRDTLYSQSVLEEVFRDSFNEDLIYFDLIWKYDNRSKVVCYEKDITLYYLFVSTLWHQATFIKRRLFDSVSMYSQNYKIASDWEFWLKTVCIHKCSMRYIPIVLSIFDMNGICRNPENNSLIKKERKEIFLKHFSYLKFIYFTFYREFESSIIYKALKLWKNFFRKQTF